MENRKRSGWMKPAASTSFRLAFLLLILATASCGPQVIEGRPPFIGISGLTLADGNFTTEFDVSNQNGVPMTITRFDISVTVNGIDMTRDERAHELVIDPNSSEEILVESKADPTIIELLQKLEHGEMKSLPFDLNGRVVTVEDGKLRFEQRGHLYPVPGKSGRYRAAVTSANELRREGKI